MQTRHKSYTQQTPPRAAEVQQQIDDDAKFAKKISRLFRSPTKKGGRGKPGSKQRRTSITPERLAFGGVGSKGQVKKGASITPKRLAMKIKENAQKPNTHLFLCGVTNSPEFNFFFFFFFFFFFKYIYLTINSFAPGHRVHRPEVFP